MIRVWIAIAAIGGLFSVAAGGAAAHLAGGMTPTAELLRTGAVYGMVHAAALLAVAAIAGRGARLGLPLAIAGWSFAIGIVLFSFSLFGLAASGERWLAALTPFGGTALLVGWAAVGLYAARGA